jgi:hypothetical protein
MKIEIENTEAFKIAQKGVDERNLRQDLALHADPPRNSKPDFDGMAFNLDLTTGEMHAEIYRDGSYFRKVKDLALKNGIGYREAELRLMKAQPGEKLLDGVSNYQNSREPLQVCPDEPGPPKIYKNPHKRRGGMTKGRLGTMAAGWLKWKDTTNAINTEESTPLDEYPDLMR